MAPCSAARAPVTALSGPIRRRRAGLHGDPDTLAAWLAALTSDSASPMSPPSCPAGVPGPRRGRRAPADLGHRVPRGPRRGRARTWCSRRPPATGEPRPGDRMRAGSAPSTDRWTATVVPDRRGLWTLRGRGLERPAGAPGGTTSRSRSTPGRAPRTWPTTWRPAPGCCERVAARVPDRTHRERARGRGRGAAGQPPRRSPDRVGPALVADAEPAARTTTRCASWSPARRATRSGWTGQRALFGSWYEFFPRSERRRDRPDGTPRRHGTFTDAAEQLTASPTMGFDVVYLPPIHPIGQVNRKGREQHPRSPEPDDVGSPWAIGSDGGRARRHPPGAGHDRRLRRLRRRAPASWAWRSRWTSRCSARRTTRG